MSFGLRMCMRQDILDHELCLPEGEKFTENLDDYHIFSAPDPHDVMTEFCTVLLNWSERILNTSSGVKANTRGI